MAYKMEADAGMVSAAELARRKRELELRQLAAQQQQATNTINKAAQPAVPAPVAPAPAATLPQTALPEVPSAAATTPGQAPTFTPYQAPQAPQSGTYTDPVRAEIDKFVSTGYMPGQTVTDAYTDFQTVKNAKPGEYTNPYDAQISEAFGNIMGRGKFQYDMNADTTYQQMKDRYLQQGNQAMMDTIGQSSALTGGYGNSWAQTAGQQAYGQHLQALNDQIPALRAQAFNEWGAEGEDLYRKMTAAQGMDDRAYGKYRDQVGDWQQDYANAGNLYTNERAFDYGQFNDQRVFDYGKYLDEVNRADSIFDADRAFGYNQYADDRVFDRSTYESDRNFGYGVSQDALTRDDRLNEYEQSRMDAEKGDARQTALKIASQLLETGRMPDQATLDAAGISVADAQQLAAAYTPVPTSSGGGGRAAKPENVSLKAENYNALRDAYVNGGDAAIERLAFDLEAQGVPAAALLNGMDVIKQGYQANSSPDAKTRQAVEGISSTLKTVGEGIASPWVKLGVTALDMLKNLGKK